MIYTLTSVGADLKWQLYDAGIDYSKIADFELFYKILCKNYPQEKTKIILGDLDLTQLELYVNKNDDEIVMCDKTKDIKIDESIYLIIVNVLRIMHGFKRNNQIPGNESTKMALIELERNDFIHSKEKGHKSQLLNLISTMVNSSGFKYDNNTVWGVNLYFFIDAVKRIVKVKNAELLLQSGYSGSGINLKEIDDKLLDWVGDLE